MKKLAIVSVIIFSICACGSTKKSSISTETPSSSDPIKIVVNEQDSLKQGGSISKEINSSGARPK